jgi:hypothetical protein
VIYWQQYWEFDGPNIACMNVSCSFPYDDIDGPIEMLVFIFYVKDYKDSHYKDIVTDIKEGVEVSQNLS